MSRSTRKAIVVGLLAAPIICCVISVGAFLHIAVSFVEAQEQEKVEMENQVQELAHEADSLESEIDNLERRIADLRQQLAEQQDRAEIAQRLKEEIRILEAQKDELERQLASFRDRLARAKLLVDQTAAKVETQRAAVTSLEEQIRRKRNELELAARGVERGEGKINELLSADELPAQSSRDLQNQLGRREASLRAQQAEAQNLQAELDGLRRRNDDMSRTFKLEELKSTRRWNAPDPVFVECDGRGVLIQTQGTRFGHWPDASETEAFVKAVRRTGYALFLIRPSGFASFLRYQELIETEMRQSGSSIDYGYEPINEDWILVYPEGS